MFSRNKWWPRWSGEGEWSESGLFELVRRAAPYEHLTKEDFESVIELVSEGIFTGRGRRGAHVHRDGVNGLLRPRRGASPGGVDEWWCDTQRPAITGLCSIPRE
jgi:hypothetical protein